MRTALLVLVCTLLFCACSKKTTTSTTTITETADTVEIVRVDTLTIEGDTVRITELIECDSITNKPKPFKLRSKSGRATLSVMVDAAGELKADATCDSLQKIIESKDKIISKLRLEKNVITKMQEPSKWQTWFDVTCKVLAALFVVVVGLRIAKVV